jgi:hypothetical protein
VATIIQDKQRGNEDRHQRWARLERAALFARYGELHAQGVSQRQAAQGLDVPRSTLQAWRAYQDRLDACPAVVAFFQSVPGLAFLHRLVIALHVVCIEIGACGIRLVCLLLKLTGLNRFVGASYGTQQQVNRHIEEAMVAYRQEESTRLYTPLKALIAFASVPPSSPKPARAAPSAWRPHGPRRRENGWEVASGGAGWATGCAAGGGKGV